MADFQKFLSSFESSNLKGKQFEKFCKWFLENDTYWKSKFTKVYLWDDYPKRWGADLGIDLIAESNDGSLCAIQAKCYSPEYPVTKKDMDSFLSESNRKEISTRLLLASTDIIGGNARKVCQSQEKPVTFFLYSDFLNSTIEFPEDINKLTKPKLKQKPKPRSHQAEAIKNVLKGFKKNDRGQLIMACGTGKTFTTLWIKEKLNAETTLILLPSLNLLSQTLKEWYFGASKPFKSFAVCSDDSVTKSTEEDAVKESTQDLSFPVSADPKQIQNFLKQKGTKVLFSTYQSSPMIAEAMKSKSVPLFDLVVCDEAHRCSGEVGGTFTTVLDDKKIRTKLKLFTTATPRTYSQSLKNNAKIKEVEIVGMDDEKIFGPVFHTLSFGQAIASDPPLLTDYQVVVVGVDSLMTKDLINERALLQIKPNDNIDAESLAAHIGLLKAIKDYGLKRLISFHNRVSRAKNFSEDLIDIKPLISKKHLPNGNLKTDYVSGDMPTKKRYQYLQQLKELNGCDYYILSNARCLSEGVDVPSIDGIAIIDPKKSKTDIVQAIGRAIRLSENKTKGTIVIPVFIANGENTEEKINNSNFKAVYDVLNALRAHDEELGFELDEMRMELGRNRTSTGPSKKFPKVFIDIPTKYSIEFSNSIQTYLVEQSTASWNFWYGLLQKYFIEHGNTRCAFDKDYEGYPLGRWISSQRSIKKTGNRGVNEDRILFKNSIYFSSKSPFLNFCL
jgi:predicted helicase